MADNIRSIPSMVDGLKPGQRKVIFGAFKKKIAGELKVSTPQASIWALSLLPRMDANRKTMSPC
jgi:hypothetical protein